MRPTLKAWWPFLCGLLPIAATLAPLFVFRAFSGDWINHVWLVGHVAARLRADGMFPVVIETQLLEPGYLSLYGFLFYPLAALPALALGPDAALRLVIIAVTLAAYASLYRCVACLTGRPWLAVFVAWVPLLAVYQLTNLYSRSAITEAVAYCLQCILVAHLVLYVRALGQSTPSRWRLLDLAIALLCLVLIVGTHPITAYLTVGAGLIVGAAIAWSVRPRLRRPDVELLVALGAVALLLVLPWLATTLLYRAHVNVMLAHLIYLEGVDSAAARLNPLLTDPRVILTVRQMGETPFLEAPINLLALALPLALAASAARGGRPAAWIAAVVGLGALAIGLTVVSIASPLTTAPPLAALVDGTLAPLQFAYRLAGLVNLLTLVALLYVLLAPPAACRLRALQDRPGVRYALAVAITLTVAAGLLKVERVFAYTDLVHARDGVFNLYLPQYWRVVGQPTLLPGTFYGIGGYATPRLFATREQLGSPDETIAAPLHRQSATHFASAEVHCARPCLLKTNAIASGLFSVALDGHEVTRADSASVDNMLAVVGAPGPHVVEVRVPWQRIVGHNVIVLTVFGWITAVSMLTVVRMRQEAPRESVVGERAAWDASRQ